MDKSEGNEAAKEEDFFAQCDNDEDFNVENNNFSQVGGHKRTHTRACFEVLLLLSEDGQDGTDTLI